jgi:hypothetical protein
MWNGGMIPLGYKAENKKLIITEDAAKIVRSIYEKYIKGCSVGELYREYGVTKGHIRNILRNPVYTGKVRYAGKLTPGNHEPIISQEIFEQAQKIHKEDIRTMRPYNNYALAGLIRCKECGSAMTPSHVNKKKNGKTKRYYYYRCTSTIRKNWNNCSIHQISAKRLESYIFDNLERISLDKQYIDNLLFRLNNSTSNDNIAVSSKNPPVLGVSGVRHEYELKACTSEITPETFSQTLTSFLNSLSQTRGLERNLLCRKFIQQVIYSKESIRIEIFCSGNSRGLERNYPRLGRSGDSSVHKEWLPGRTGHRTIGFLMPNRIDCRKQRSLPSQSYA